MGITAMQWVEGILWLDGPTPHGALNQLLTIGLIPLALLAQAWGPLLGSTFELPVRGRQRTIRVWTLSSDGTPS